MAAQEAGEAFLVMGVGEGEPRDFEVFSKKSCFLSFEWVKSPSGPPGKNPSDAREPGPLVRGHKPSRNPGKVQS